MTANLLDEMPFGFPPERRNDDVEPRPAEALRAAAARPYALVVDDEPGICQFIAMALGTMGIEAQSAPSAEQALASLRQRMPAMIFLDVALKKSDAIDVIRGLGELAYGGVVQVMSGSDPELLADVRRVGQRHGLNMHPPLSKPFRIDALRRIIEQARLGASPQSPDASAPAAPDIGLGEALVKGWLELWYQPKIDLRKRTLAGAEGLIRCRHPVHGVLSPANFVPTASAAELEALTEHVVITAMRDWDQFAQGGGALHVAVNTSIGALANLHLPTLIREHRPRSPHWPGLILEVTESEVAKDIALAHEIATQLRIYGITLSIDDFGEGYSSFARLRELPFAELKLDGGFVRDCGDDLKNAGICQAIIDLAHHFGAVAVAEGLETAADVQAVHRMGCDVGQGYFLAKPMPKARLAAAIQHAGKSRHAS
jgi:EAL domain-containing protein (putative c-di-GMP-specific phosphodiesterase class I)